MTEESRRRTPISASLDPRENGASVSLSRRVSAANGRGAPFIMFAWLLLATAWLLSGIGTATAFDTAPDQFQQKLQSYDPAAVEAARAYAKTFNMKGMMEKAVPLMARNFGL